MPNGEVRRPIERVDHPHRLVLAKQVEAGRIGRAGFFSDHDRTREQAEKFMFQPAFHRLIGRSYDFARGLFTDVTRRKVAKARHDFDGGRLFYQSGNALKVWELHRTQCTRRTRESGDIDKFRRNSFLSTLQL